MKFNTLYDILAQGKRVLIRADLNTPIDDNGNITDDTRILAAIPTIKFITEQGGKAILMSHLGRPDGQRVDALSLAPVASRLAQLMKKDVSFAPDCIGEATKKMTDRMQNGDILLLENVRFYSAETHPQEDPMFAENLARLGDIYVNDAFATAHRKHSSNYEVAKLFEKPAAGFLVEKEVLILTNLLTQAQPPFYAIIGGSKISSKIGILEALLPKVDALFIGGAMSYTFIKALGHNVGNSLVDEDHLDTAKHLMKKMKSKSVDLYLPKDHLVAKSLTSDAENKIVFTEEGIDEGYIGVDIGPETVNEWSEALKGAQTIFWNGPLGIFEIPAFSKGTFSIAKILAGSPAMTIIGGGDSAAAISETGLSQKITRISTGGGATLKFIEDGTLDALLPLEK